MNGAVRQRIIREMLEVEEFLDIERLKSALDASESTIRRDLAGLETEGVLKRVYGGAMAMQTKPVELSKSPQNTAPAPIDAKPVVQQIQPTQEMPKVQGLE